MVGKPSDIPFMDVATFGEAERILVASASWSFKKPALDEVDAFVAVLGSSNYRSRLR